MTKRCSYTCNLCHSDMRADEGWGIMFAANHTINFVEVTTAENHLCNDCIVGFDKKQLEPNK